MSVSENKKLQFNVVTKPYRIFAHDNDRDFDGTYIVKAASEEGAKIVFEYLTAYQDITIKSIEEVKEE